MPKRKRTDEENAALMLSLSEGRPKRRRNDTTLVDTIQYIFDALRNKKKDDDSYLCEAFLRVPRKKTEPQYYEMIKSPIDMLKIQQKIKTDVYNQLEEFVDDIQLLVENAKLYYAKSTEEHKDACELWALFEEARVHAPDIINKEKQPTIHEDDDRPIKRRGRPPKAVIAMSAPMIMEEEGKPMTTQEAVEELFGAVITAMDAEGRFYSYDFHILPNAKKYPEYYQVITRPIDMKIMATKISMGQYADLDSLEKDFALMFENAFTFNEPGSRIYKDANTLLKVVKMRKQDLNHVLSSKKGVRLRSRRPMSNKKWHELMLELEPGGVLPLPEDDQGGDAASSAGVHDEEDSDDDIDNDSPLWQLLIAVKAYILPSDSSYQLIEPFKRLPNKRWHADYYQEIKYPISLSQIKKKLMRNEYNAVEDMVVDFNLMFENAQSYNRPDSRIHKDAIKLQKFVQTKAEELKNFPFEEEESASDSNDDEDSHTGKKKLSCAKPLTFKRRAKILFKTLMDYMTDDGRQPIVAFIEKPTRKDYPDYYEVISNPIDMENIEDKIRGDFYQSEEELIADFRLMFSNCQTYNEEGSHIFQDSNILLKVLNDKIQELNKSPGRGRPCKPKRYTTYINISKNIKSIYSAVREYMDGDGRQLSEVFMRVPSKLQYPDYYEVIKHPIDLERLFQKQKNNAYSAVDDIISDMTLVFQNACRYNDPDSQIYRDALTLQRIALMKRTEFEDDCAPNVCTVVLELFMCLFIGVYNYEDENGRYPSESFSELPEYEEIDGKKQRALNFDIMKRRLDKGLYSRLDHFQEDMFSIFDRARKLSKLDSKIYFDSVLLQKEYIKMRDELCKGGGGVLESKALSFTNRELKSLLENMKGIKESELEEGISNDQVDDDDSRSAVLQSTDNNNSSSMSHNQVQYYVGDFVYLIPPEKNSECPIMHIQRMWMNTEGRQMIYGPRYYRPAETFHMANRKFYEQELFKTDVYYGSPLSDIIRKCVVLPVSDYPKYKAEGFSDSDTYVCECRYSTKNRFFKKIKTQPFTIPERVQLIEREVSLELKRVGSVFKERVEKHKEELAELEEETKMLCKCLPNVVKMLGPEASTGNTYYEQYNAPIGVIKLGDFVYVRSKEIGKTRVRHINRIWVSPEGSGFFQGTIYVHSNEAGISNDKLLYKKEMYLTATQETLPLSDIVKKCSVLFIKDYTTCRFTEIAEPNVYVCECFLDEMNQRVSSLQTGLLKFKYSDQVQTDEVYYFKHPLHVQRDTIAIVEGECEDSMDGLPNSVTSLDSVPAVASVTPKVTKKSKAHPGTGKKLTTGYLLFSAEIRKSITQRNPEANFGEISRLVGVEWKKLTETERKAFEDRAHQINLENAEKNLINPPDSPHSQVVSSDLPLPNNPDVVFECMWESCDHMFEDLADLADHLLNDSTGHVYKVVEVFECSWKGCSRHKKSSLAPFPSNQRLARHVREVHILKNTGRVLQFHDRSRNFTPSSRRSLLNVSASGSPAPGYPQSNSPYSVGGRASPYQITIGGSSGGINAIISYPQGNPCFSNGTSKGANAIFVDPPPRTQRLLHSEAYIKYIENLDKPYISDWPKHMSATQDNIIINDSTRLPAHWFADGPGSHGNVISALWALREYMMKDSLGIAKIL